MTSDDTLKITSGSYTFDTIGNDFVVKVGEQSVLIKPAYVSDVIKIADSSGEVEVYNDWTIWNGSIKENKKSNVTLAGSKKNDTIGNYGDNVLITGRAGNDSIKNEDGDNATISGGAGNDSISNYGSSTSISGGAGDDAIKNYGDNVTISGGSSNDSIYNLLGWYVTINGGSGNDTIRNRISYVTISGGTGSDYISLRGGAENNVIRYAKGDGNDTIVGFNSTDTLNITKGSYKTSVSGDDVIVTVGKGSIILKDSVGKKISIKNSSGKTTTKTYGSAGLFAEDNFVENELDSIIENKSPVVPEEFKISVLIPLYNRKNYIEDCISSALNQSFQDFEIIICDDFSTDGVRELTEKLFSAEISSGKIKLYEEVNSVTKVIQKLGYPTREGFGV